MVASQLKPKSAIEIVCGFDRTKALVGAGAAVEKLNETFDDDMDPEYVVRAVALFFKHSADLKCRSCGYVKNGKCTVRGHTIDPGQSCTEYRYELVIRDD